jgi:hypothetical protein
MTAWGKGFASPEQGFRDFGTFQLGDGFDRIALCDNSDEWDVRRSAQRFESHFYHAGNLSRAAFVPHNCEAFAFKLIRERLLGQT